MGALCCCDLHSNHEKQEKQAILIPQVKVEKNHTLLRRTSVSSGSEGQAGGDPEQGSWISHSLTTCFTETDEDEELSAFIRMRNQTDKATEEWEKLNYDIHTLRCTRREVSARWRKILLQLGYQREVDSLLRVNRQTVLSDGDNMERASELVHSLCEESRLFPRGVVPNDRYVFVMDRLVSLDSAEDFIRLAKEKYPKTDL